jgi:hypothetical protein
MKTTCTFRVAEFVPVDYTPEIATGLPTGHARMVKEYTGEVTGRSMTQFSYAYDDERGGTYVATESFEGTLDGRVGCFNFVHSATDLGGGSRDHEFFLIVPGSGTGALKGISGTGALVIDGDGTHRMEFDYELA